MPPIEHSDHFWQIEESIPNLASHVFSTIGPFAISNTTTTILLIAVMVLFVGGLLTKSKERPSFFQNVMEYVYEVIFSFVAQILGDKDRAKKVVPYVGAIILFLLISNLLPLLPLLLAFTISSHGEAVPLFRGTTTDFNTTFSLALAAVLIIQVIGIKEQGLFGYLSHFIQAKQIVIGFRKSFKDGMTAIIGFFVGLIEIIGELAKVLSLSLRLFGNMFAHEVLTIILIGVFAFGLPAIWMGMGVLVGVVQSIVFAALITVYYSLVLKKEH